MKITTLKCTVIGIILALIITLVFNVSYYITMLVLSNSQYALNMASAASVIILIGTFIDIFKSIHVEREQAELPAKEPKIERTVQPDDIKQEIDPNKKDASFSGQDVLERIQYEGKGFMDAREDMVEAANLTKLEES